VGRLGFFRIHRFWRYPYFPDMDPAGPRQWRRSGEQSGGWVINDIGSHLLDLMLWISNLKATVMGAALTAQQFELATEDSAAVLVRLGESAIGIMETSCANDSPGSRIELYGGSGWIRAEDTLSGEASIVTHDGRRQTFPAVEMLDTYSAEVTDFIAAVQGKPSIGADGAAGAQLVGIIEAAVGAGSRG
jgi:predicted dehydrogenase